VTFGIYELYWFYKNWKFIKQRTGENIMPFWRAFFGVIFCYSCFKEIRETAKTQGVSLSTSAGLLATVWIILTVSWRLPDPFWLVTMATPFILIPIQQTVNTLNKVVAPDHNPNARFSAWNIVGIVFGVLWLTLVIVGLLLPQSPPPSS
jgi:hypothetical protein